MKSARSPSWFWCGLLIFLCNFSFVSAGVDEGQNLLGDARQRNIFPLPRISHDAKSDTQGTDWKDFANCGIRALNELAGCHNSEFSRKKPTRVQKRAIEHISKSFQDVYSVDDVDPGRSALEDLCSLSRLYQMDRSDVVSYVKESVSWPQVESSPVDLGSCLTAADSERLATWRKHMLKPSDSVADEKAVKHAYMDPILKHNMREYVGFIRELQSRHMVAFKPSNGETGELGIFFVRKKNGKQRLIFDTRALNQKFLEPPSTDLPSADSFTRVELPENHSFFVGSGDLANAFYTLGVPDDLAQMFTLPPIKAEYLGVDNPGGESWRRGQWITPYLTVLPMGWAWSLHLCQSVLMKAIKDAGFDVDQVISDKGRPVHLRSTEQIGCGGYVDNFIVIGCNPDLVNAGLQRIGDILRGRGLTVHEEETATHKTDFVGLSFDGIAGTISIKPQRIVKLQRAITELLARNFASGEILQLIVGHLTWAVMTRREGLSILKSCYAFIHENQSKPKRLWPTVRWELETISAILPLFKAQINVGWSDDLTASDSSPYGYGVCSRKCDIGIISAVGAQSERWRFRFEDAVDARRHAAKSIGRETLDKNVKAVIEDIGSDVKFIEGFNEVPIQLLSPDLWKVVWSNPWKFEDNILHTEALALCWSIEHTLRANRNFGRILFLSDNLPLTLGVCKGRAKSGFLTKPLRKICALALATGSKFHVRWVPSEWNTADRPSRALTQWCSRGLNSWFKHDESLTSIQSRNKSFNLCRSSLNSPTSPANGAALEKEKGGGQREFGATRTDISGGSKCEAAHSRGLHEKVHGVQAVVGNSSTGDPKPRADGCSHDRVSARNVRCKPRGERRDQGSRSRQIPCPSPLHCIGPNFKGPPGLEPRSTPTAENAHSDRSFDGSDREVLESEPYGVEHAVVPSVFNLHEARGVQPIAGETVSATPTTSQSDFQVLGDFASPCRGSGTRKNRGFRCFSDSRLRRLDIPHVGAVEDPQVTIRPTLEPESRLPSRVLQPGDQIPQTGTTRTQPVCLKTRGRQPRCLVEESAHVGSETKGSVEFRCFPQEICQGGKTPDGVVKSSKGGQGVRTVGAKPTACALEIAPSDAKGTRWNNSITRRMKHRARSCNIGPKSLSGAVVLKRIFRSLAQKHKGSFRGVFLDIFCGDGSVSHYLSRNGHPVISIDICVDSRFDVLNREIFKTISGCIKDAC